MKKILLTGHKGLIGRWLKPFLELKGFLVTGFDRSNGSGDINDLVQLKRAVKDCYGIVHAAAVSRVIWGEQNPKQCWQTNSYQTFEKNSVDQT